MARFRPRRVGVWLMAGVATLAVLIFGGTWIYIHLIEGPAPAPLSLKSSSSSSASPTLAGASSSTGASAGTTTSLAGTWRVAAGSIVGYRVSEVLAGQNNIAVGRTNSISGGMNVSGTTVTAATFTVQMATIHSDQGARDAQFNGRIMDTATFPTGTLTLTSPIAIGAVPADGVVKTYDVTANLTLHGHTKSVKFGLQAERTAGGVEVSGSIPVLFANWGIANPSFGSFVTTQDHGQLEFLVKFVR